MSVVMTSIVRPPTILGQSNIGAVVLQYLKRTLRQSKNCLSGGGKSLHGVLVSAVNAFKSSSLQRVSPLYKATTNRDSG